MSQPDMNYSTALAIPALLAAALAAQTNSSFLVAPGAADRFLPAISTYQHVNGFLATTLANMAYPDFVGVDPTNTSDYYARVRLLLTGTTEAEPAANARLGGWRFRKVTFFRSGLTPWAPADTEGFIASNDDYAIVSIRGSEGTNAGLMSFFVDYALNDLRAAPVAYGGGQVHTGFLNAMLDSVTTIRNQLRAQHDFQPFVMEGNIVRPNPLAGRPIWFCGHSLGGAAATLSAFHCKTMPNFVLPVRGAYVTGCPMVGNTAFANAYTNAGLALHRITNNMDLPARIFGDLPYLPEDLNLVAAGIIQRVFINGAPAPVRDAMLLLAQLLFSAANALPAGLADHCEANPNYVHFGSHRYFDRTGAEHVNPSLAFRRADWRARMIERLTPVFLPYAPPPAPAPLWPAGTGTPAQWQTWTIQCAAITNSLLALTSNPLPILIPVGQATLEMFGDHHPSAYQSVMRARIVQSGISLSDLPGS